MISLAFCLALSSPIQTTWHVDNSNAGPGTGSAADPYPSIEGAIQQATTASGDTLLVHPGIYTGETIDFQGKELLIRAAQGLGSVTVQGPLSAQGQQPHLPGSGARALVRVVNGEGPGTEIKDIQFYGGAGEDIGAQAVGGVLYVNGSHLRLTHCRLTGTSNTLGGIGYCVDGTLECVNSRLTGSTFNPNGSNPSHTYDVTPIGGCIAGLRATITFENCDVLGSTPQSSVFRKHRGMLLNLVDSQTTILNSRLHEYSACISGCRATSQVFVEQGSLLLDHSTFSNFGASRDIVAVEAEVTIQNMDFDQNSGSYNGRVLRATACQTRITNCTFTNGTHTVVDQDPAEPFPGGQITHTGLLEIDGCVFSGNSNAQGGAIAADVLIVRNSVFRNNHAMGGSRWPNSIGGAIYAVNAIVLDSLFEGNRTLSADHAVGTSTGSALGGALYLTGASSIRRTDFIDNQAISQVGGLTGKQAGGAIYALEPVRLEDCELIANKAKIDTVMNGPAGVANETIGGAVFLGFGGDLVQTIFEGNSTASPNFDTGGRVSRGGAVHLAAGILSIRQSQFRGNQSEVGAALFVDSPGIVSVEGSLFDGNTLVPLTHSTDVATGAAWAGFLTATQCTLVQHTAAQVGGDTVNAGLLDSCIVWDNAPSTLPPQAQAVFSIIEGGDPGVGTSVADPLFWSASDFHLLPTSPAIDAGNPTLSDLNGTRSDMGYAAFDPLYCSALCAVPLGSVTCLSNAGSTGVTAGTEAYGDPSASSNFLTLASHSLSPGSVGYYLTSQTQGFTPLFGGSAGNLCLGGSLHRMIDKVLVASDQGALGRTVDLTQLAYTQVVLPGSTWHFQLWYRDGGSPGINNTTDSIRVSFQ